MLKLLITACLVTHGICRPDVSHILKQNRTNKAIHSPNYQNQPKIPSDSKVAQRNAFDAYDYFSIFNKSVTNNVGTASPFIHKSVSGRNDWSRGFLNAVKPSPFKRNVAQDGYTYEKPAVPLPIKPGGPLDFPINPDANLIKPISTHAPEYLPPVQQGPSASTQDGSSIRTSTQAPVTHTQSVDTSYDSSSQPSSAGMPITGTIDGNAQSTYGIEQHESEQFTTTTPSYKPQQTTTTNVNIGSQDAQNNIGYQPSHDSETTTENVFTGYTRGPAAPSTNTYTQSSISDYSQQTTSTPNVVSPYAESTPSSLASTESSLSIDGSPQSTPSTSIDEQGYNYNKPIIPPNLDDVVGEPVDINELATTTPSTTTTTKFNGYFIPPKPLPGLVVPGTPGTSSEQTPIENTATVKPQIEITIAITAGPSGSTTAPEYLPPGDSSETNAPHESTEASATNLPSSEPNIPFSGYPSYSPTITDNNDMTTNSAFYTTFQSTSTESYSRPDDGSTAIDGYSPAGSSSTVYTQTSVGPDFSTTIQISGSTGYEPSEYSTPGQSSSYGPYGETTVREFSSPSLSTQPNNEPQYSTSPSATEQSSFSTGAPEYLPPDAGSGTAGYYYPPANNFSAASENNAPNYQPQRTDQPPTNTSNQPISESPVEAMTIISEINNLVPEANSESTYLPPGAAEDNAGLRIVVEDSPLSSGNVILPQERHSSTAADTITTYHPTKPPRTTAAVVESEAEGSELQPQLAVAAPAPASEPGYNYQVPGDKLPPASAVVPSHTLDDHGYHYKIPSVPFH